MVTGDELYAQVREDAPAFAKITGDSGYIRFVAVDRKEPALMLENRLLTTKAPPGSLRRRYRTARLAVTRYAAARRAWHAQHGTMPIDFSVDFDMRQLERAVVRRLVDLDGDPDDRAAELPDHMVESFSRPGSLTRARARCNRASRGWTATRRISTASPRTSAASSTTNSTE